MSIFCWKICGCDFCQPSVRSGSSFALTSQTFFSFNKLHEVQPNLFSFVEVLKARAFCCYSKLTIYGISFQHRKSLKAPRSALADAFDAKLHLRSSDHIHYHFFCRMQIPFFNACGRKSFPSSSAMLFSRPTKIFMLVYPLHLCEIFSRVKAIFCML